VTVSKAKVSAIATPTAASAPPVAEASAVVRASVVCVAEIVTLRLTAIGPAVSAPTTAVVRTFETMMAIDGVTVTSPPFAPICARAAVRLTPEAARVRSRAPARVIWSASSACVSCVTSARANETPTPASPVAVTPSPVARALTVVASALPAAMTASPPVRTTAPRTAASVSNQTRPSATEPATDTLPPPAPTRRPR
jgi:hypothetical protein